MLGVGIGVALVAALGNAISVVLLALEARKAPDSESMHASMFKRLARRPRWLAAVGVMIFAGVLQIASLSLAPIAVVQPTLATSQLILLAIARVRRPDAVGWREVAGSLLLVGGIGCMVAAAPSEHTGYSLTAGLIAPMAVVGGLAVATFVAGRAHPRARGLLIVGAGLAYAWADFVAKLLSDAADKGTWWLMGVWIAAIIAVGALAFLQENSALQHKLAISVAPVIVAFKVPLPVLMALWSGVEPWRGGAVDGVLFAIGLVVSAGGAYALGSSHAVAQVSAADGGSRSPPRADGEAADSSRADASALALERGGGQTIPPTSASDPGASSGANVSFFIGPAGTPAPSPRTTA